MDLLLHLSDIHLGTAGDKDVVGDYKTRIVPLDERQRRHPMLAATLQELVRWVKPNGLAGLVVSGDITVANNVEGFKQFDAMLGNLGDALPDPDRIVVLPGNHDLPWGTPPSSAERYEQFIEYIRDAGYITPLLDGIDIDADGKPLGPIEVSRHVLLAADQSWVVVPLNTSNYCGAVEPLDGISEDVWSDIPGTVEDALGVSPKALEKELQRLRVHDMARVTPGQLKAVHDLLAKVPGAGPDQLRIAALHHHLLPVSPLEESKTYEAIVNLGMLRLFLRDNNFRVVLHGHKHKGFVYQDYIYSQEGLLGDPVHRVLVLAGGSIGSAQWDEAEICRLISVDASRFASQLGVATVPAISPGSPLKKPRYETLRLWGTPPLPGTKGDPHLVVGDTVDHVYERANRLLDYHTEVTHLVCQVRDAASAEKLPEAYPDVPGNDDLQRWYTDIVTWWQKPSSELGERLRFSHGARIYAWPDKIDQVERAADALGHDSETSRAIVTLLDPSRDKTDRMQHKFPAFCLVQLVPRRQGSKIFLDCIGYFRKQEMRYWWPVNLGELRHIQKTALDHLAGKGNGWFAGSLVTVSASAVAGVVVPRVALPLVDKKFDDDSPALWALAYAVVWDDMPERSAALGEWEPYLDDLVPGEQPDPDGVPVALEGVRYLADTLNLFAAHHSQSAAATLGGILTRLYKENAAYADKTAVEVKLEVHRLWRKEVMRLVDEIRAELGKLRSEDALSG